MNITPEEKNCAAKEDQHEVESESISRREMLKLSAIAGTGIILGMSGMATLMSFKHTYQGTGSSSIEATKPQAELGSTIPFYGTRQAGIVTPQQQYVCFAAFDILHQDAGQLLELLKVWSAASHLMTAGKSLKDDRGFTLATQDTGETKDLPPSNLTLTFGFGPTLFQKGGKDRFGFASEQPTELNDIPPMFGDRLNPQWSGGDIGVQACADTLSVALHAIRNLAKISKGTAIIRWVQNGYVEAPDGQTPRNLFGFKDGTANRELESNEAKMRHLWVSSSDEPAWMTNGTYMVMRKIRMFLELWDQSSLAKQESTFGRLKDSGAPFGKKNEFDPTVLRQLPSNSHVWLARNAGTKLLRRAYSYVHGFDSGIEDWDAGLLFISFQRSIKRQFIPMLSILAKKDALNKFTSHVSSAVFACPPGASEGGFVGETLFGSKR
ncbi:iron uptake transporter deferrochelatase/peroxidase subunit [Paenibacillus tyrfis]|uniref:iron uptake transporter deferrochelatase/peroxidase subunit n=1 Tax=Paenibacillus tyrfis TaxID=1501230 RepID=UPI0020A13DB6|nr:iron uptake transporter deferrochelatase/peroxidase subunit [Paenibacillus tyrfis]MCP1312410.1 iron uptake transporter deferrochelatase/peroxidase subunit [Paenibacillus tyrfis]